MTIAIFAASVCGAAMGCEKSDVGATCQVLPGRNEMAIPTANKTPEGEWIDDISLDPGFDCEFLTCVSYQGSTAYCTRKCGDAADCPEGFECNPVIQSDPCPPDMPNCSGIGPNDKFCVCPTVPAEGGDHMCEK